MFVAILLAGGERLVPKRLVDLALVIIGVALLTGVTIQDPLRLKSLGIIAGLFSGVSYAVFIFGFRNASHRGSPQAIKTIAFSVECFALFATTGERATSFPIIAAEVKRARHRSFFSFPRTQSDCQRGLPNRNVERLGC